MLDFGLYLFYAMTAIAVLGAVGFAIYNAIQTPGSLIKSLIGIGALLALFGVAYALSGNEVTTAHRALGVSESTSKLIGAGLILFYLSLVLGIIALLYSEISKAFK